MAGIRASMRRFEGTDTYVATQDLQIAVNAAIALERPLLVKGEPGTGKTILAHEVARGIDKDLMCQVIKSLSVPRATSWARIVLPVPGSPLTSSGRSKASTNTTRC